MKLITKYWKTILAVLLAAASVPLFILASNNTREYESEIESLNSTILSISAGITSNQRYEGVQGLIDPELEKLQASRQALYSHFPVDLKEEDQIRYIMYLEEALGTDLQFSFSQITPALNLSDGAVVGGITFTLSYQTTYEGFKDLVDFFATDERVASVRYASLNYDAASDVATGSITITLYTIADPATPYEPPEASDYETGKETIFE